MNIWLDKNADKCLSILFNKDLIKAGITRTSNKAVKGVDSIYQGSISIFGLIITYGDFNYNRIIHIMVNQKDNYKRSANSHEINILKETLLEYIRSNDFKNIFTPFNWNYSFDINTGEIIYYITGEKEWFEKNNLKDLVSWYIEICSRNKIIENIKKFPKYNLRKVNKVIGWIKN